jgi:crotonobetainyl-CoA:carnitine CoA-transferase CaiB-like acyl-CoA transferase
VEIDDPVLGKVRTVDTPMQIEGHPKTTPMPAPRLGEHTSEVLVELGLMKEEISALAKLRIVASCEGATT